MTNYHSNIKSEHNIQRAEVEPYLSLLNSVDNVATSVQHKILNIDDKLSHKLLLNNTVNELNNIITQRKTINDLTTFDCKKIIRNDDKIKQNIMEMLCESLFIPFSIVQWIETQCDHCYIMTWDKVTIHVLNDSNVDDTMLREIVKIVKWMIVIKGQQEPILNIYIYLSKCKKEIGENMQLGFNEINSGVSYGGRWLQIFRKEELYKVLIHELIHNMTMDIDRSISFSKELSNFHMHPDSQPLIVNEGYVEALSVYFYAIYISNGSGVHEIILDEEKFTIYQINKIFKHYKIKNIDYFSKENNFIQNTNVIPYFLLKYLFLINIRYFVRCFDDKSKTVLLLKRSLNKLFQLKIPKVEVQDKSLKMIFNE